MNFLLAASLLVAVACGAAQANLLDSEWSAFKLVNRKQYTSPIEELARRGQWEENMKLINEHNAAYARGEFDFDLAMNHLADLHHTEVKDMLNGLQQPGPDYVSNNPVFDASSAGDLPPAVDWRDQNLVTPVKNQGQCGSCWAFSAIAGLEGQHAKKNGALVSLSEQNLVDCSTPQKNEGCRGGWMDQAFQYIRDNGGVDTEASYPYTASDDKCKFSKDNIGATLVNYTDIPKGDEKALQAAIATVGPISVAIDASGFFFQFYHSGVFHGLFCSANRLDHGVTAVGYGTLNGKDYYLIKNSWGERWGQKGYIFMSRNRGNNCGVATAASYPIV